MPYSELSESEKDYDRKTVTEVLKTIIAFGYDIKRRPRRPTGMWLRGKCRQVPDEKKYKMKLDRPVQVCEPPIASACAPEDRQN